MGLKASIQKRWFKLVSQAFYSLGRIWSRFPFVEIWGVHLGHTIFESTHFLQHRPLLIFWRKPLANQWLAVKLSQGVRFPSLQRWFIKKNLADKKNLLLSAVKTKAKTFSSQYFLMNLAYNCLPHQLPRIAFTPKEKEHAEEFIKSSGLARRKYVCFCIRDESYYKEFKPDLFSGPAKNFEFRNAKIENYAEAAKFLRSKGIWPVLMGFSSFPAPDVFFRPALCPEFRPWIEAYLFQHCLFCVGMMTGTTLYASLFKRPILWSDAFWRGTPVGGRQDLILPKKIIQRENKTSKRGKQEYKELHLKEWVRLGPPPDNDWWHFSKKGIEIQSCTKKEILAAVKDMLGCLQSKKAFSNRQALVLHRAFSKIHLKSSKKLGHPPTRLAPSWAKANKSLLVSPDGLYEKFWLDSATKENMDLQDLFQERQTKKIILGRKPQRSSEAKFPLGVREKNLGELTWIKSNRNV